MLLKTGVDRSYFIFRAIECGKGNRRGLAAGMRRQIPYFAYKLVAIHLGHADITDYDIRPVYLYLFQSVGSVAGRNHAGVVKSQYELGKLQSIRFVIHDQYFQSEKCRTVAIHS